MPTKALLSPLTEFICISSATVTQRGAVCPLTSQLTNCLTIIACTPFYTTLPDSAFASCGTRAAKYPLSDFTPSLQCRLFPPFLFYNRVLFAATLQRWCWISCCYPGWLPLTPRYLYAFISRLTEGVPELLQLGWFMTSSCSWSPWPTQLGVRCGLPESRNLSAAWNQPRPGQAKGVGVKRRAEGQRWSGRSEGEEEKINGLRGSRWERTLG